MKSNDTNADFERRVDEATTWGLSRAEAEAFARKVAELMSLGHSWQDAEEIAGIMLGHSDGDVVGLPHRDADGDKPDGLVSDGGDAAR